MLRMPSLCISQPCGAVNPLSLMNSIEFITSLPCFLGGTTFRIQFFAGRAAVSDLPLPWHSWARLHGSEWGICDRLHSLLVHPGSTCLSDTKNHYQLHSKATDVLKMFEEVYKQAIDGLKMFVGVILSNMCIGGLIRKMKGFLSHQRRLFFDNLRPDLWPEAMSFKNYSAKFPGRGRFENGVMLVKQWP